MYVHCIRIALVVLITGTLVACARPRPVTAARSVDAPSPREVPAAAPLPAGELACTTRDDFGVVTELYLEGESGTLRRVTPSGMNEEQPLRVERAGDALIGDSPLSDDLAVHAVTLRKARGKTFVRLGDWHQNWSACL